MRTRVVACLCLTAAVAGRSPARAQRGIGTQVWTDFNPAWAVSARGMVFGDVGVRTDIDGSGWWRFVLRPSYAHRLSPSVQIGGGVGSFYLAANVIADRWELRPWQGVLVDWPRAGLPLHHYIRLEERFDLNTRSWEAVTSLRGRYQLRTHVDWGDRRPGAYWRLMGGIEGFLTLAGSTGLAREQFRISVWLERGIRPGLRVQSEVAWQRVGWLFGDAKSDDLLLRLRVYRQWGGG